MFLLSWLSRARVFQFPGVRFQVWMCGGQLMIATCSHVGHVFRKSTPYTFPGGTSKIVNHNNARLAEVWLDDWKEFYFSINPGEERRGTRTRPLMTSPQFSCWPLTWLNLSVWSISKCDAIHWRVLSGLMIGVGRVIWLLVILIYIQIAKKSYELKKWRFTNHNYYT